MTRRLFLLGLMAPALAACARNGPPSGPAPGQVQRGLASWYGYGDGFHGRRTASGERFDMNKLTAAHVDLPFGTRIRVRNLRNDRRVDLIINDRFPREALEKGRVLDVSYGAAKRLDMVEDGVVPVEFTIRALPQRG
jgi:rare lipoprotein A